MRIAKVGIQPCAQLIEVLRTVELIQGRNHALVARLQEGTSFAGKPLVVEPDKHTHPLVLGVENRARDITQAWRCEPAGLEFGLELGFLGREGGVEMEVHPDRMLGDQTRHEVDHVLDVLDRLFVGHALVGLLQEVALDAEA